MVIGAVQRRRFLSLVVAGLAGAPLVRVASVAADADQHPVEVPVWLPPDLAAGEQWAAVNLTYQAVVAMRGADPIWVALTTTGRDGWKTPEGIYFINRRVANETMTSAALGITDPNDYYVLTDVLFTQYFTYEGHALHLNYWQPDAVFGRRRTSHGCVGLRYDDAAFFWEFLRIGSRVVIHS